MTKGTYLDKDGNAHNITIDTSIIDEIQQDYPDPKRIKTDIDAIGGNRQAKMIEPQSRLETMSVQNIAVIGILLGMVIGILAIEMLYGEWLPLRIASGATLAFGLFWLSQNLFRARPWRIRK